MRPVVAATLALGLVACPGGREPNKVPASASPSITPGVRGGTLNIAIADDAGALDPQLASEPGAFALIRATQRGLMAFPSAAGEAGAVPVPDLAEKLPAVSANGLLYSFRLREGAKIGNRPLVAADVVAGITRALRLGAASGAFRVVDGAVPFVAGRAATVSGLAAPDTRTVNVRLTRAVNDLLWMLAISAASAVPPGLGTAVSPRDIPASGPYRLEVWEPGERMKLVRNSSWSQSSDPIRAAWVNAIEVRVGAWKDADLAGEGVSATGPVKLVRGDCLLYLFVNPRVKPFDEIRIRRGIKLAVGQFGLTEPAYKFLRPETQDELTPSPRTREAAEMIGRQFSTRIGFERRGPDAAVDEEIAKTIIGRLAAAGVTARPLLGPGAIGPSAYDLYERGNVPMGFARWCPDWPGRNGRAVLQPLLGSGGVANYTRTADRELDRLIAAATGLSAPATSRTTAELDRAWAAAEGRALSLATVIPLAFYDEPALVSKRVKGFVAHPLFTRGDPTNVWVA